jgi:hypothetical protein
MNEKSSFPRIRRAAMRAFAFVATVGLVLTGSTAEREQAQKLPEPPSPDQAYQQLLSIDRFAFGGVGYAGNTSRGEIAYRAVAGSTSALQLFSSALTNGNAQTKLYALCGIRQFSPGSFPAHARSVVVSSPEVETMAGCIVRNELTSNVVARIASGSYDLYLKAQQR